MARPIKKVDTQAIQKLAQEKSVTLDFTGINKYKESKVAWTKYSEDL